MRVIAGTARGLRIDAPSGGSVRPTSDRVREATFNALGSMDLVSGAVFSDLFAGSGALGIEALSRGAAWCTFYERDRGVAEVLRANLERTGTAERAEVVVADVMDRLTDGVPAGSGPSHGRAAGHVPTVEVALADPPYGFDRWGDLMARVPAFTLVAESDRDLGTPPGWRELRRRRYGGTVVTILERSTAADPL